MSENETPMLQYGDEIGIGEDLSLPERNAARTPMQWTDDRHGGFSTAAKVVRPVIDDPVYGYRRLNVEAQRRDPNSLLNWMARMIRMQNELPEIAWGMGMRRSHVAILLAVVAAAVALYLWQRGGPASRSAEPGLSVGTGAGSARHDASGGQRRPKPLPPRRDRIGTTPALSGAGSAKRLVALFDTGALCEQHNAQHCAAMRAATERCDRDEAEGCRAALALVDAGKLRDVSLALLFARRVCETSGDCARREALEQFRKAGTDPAAGQAAARACDGGDAVGCAFAMRAATDEAEAARYADLACRGGVIALGGCFDVNLSAIGTPTGKAALEHACKSGSADGCDLLGRHAFDAGDLDDARVVLARACELAPGGDGCIALEALDQMGSPYSE